MFLFCSHEVNVAFVGNSDFRGRSNGLIDADQTALESGDRSGFITFAYAVCYKAAASRNSFEVRKMRSRVLVVATLLLTCLPASQSEAATATIRDGSTLQLGNVTYRLDGIDAPTFDQLCIDDHADSWTCGVEARDRLTKLIGGRQVRCDDLGVDPTYKKRHIGVCKVEGETTSLSQLLVRMGFALNVEASDRKSTRLNSSHIQKSRMPSSA